MKKIAVIPARGGSKRIPRKNVRLFAGKPIIAWSIEAAKASGLFDHVIVTTDDAEIMQIAEGLGAAAPFVRPPELSDDFVPTTPVVQHAAEWMEKEVGQISHVCTLYATAPFVRASDIRDAFALMKDSNAEIVFAATSFPFPIQRAIRIDTNGRAAMFQPEHYLSRSQDLEPAYHDAGQFYWQSMRALREALPAFSEFGSPLILPRHRVQDIDTPEDWERAELMFKLLQMQDNTLKAAA